MLYRPDYQKWPISPEQYRLVLQAYTQGCRAWVQSWYWWYRRLLKPSDLPRDLDLVLSWSRLGYSCLFYLVFLPMANPNNFREWMWNSQVALSYRFSLHSDIICGYRLLIATFITILMICSLFFSSLSLDMNSALLSSWSCLTPRFHQAQHVCSAVLFHLPHSCIPYQEHFRSIFPVSAQLLTPARLNLVCAARHEFSQKWMRRVFLAELKVSVIISSGRIAARMQHMVESRSPIQLSHRTLVLVCFGFIWHGLDYRPAYLYAHIHVQNLSWGQKKSVWHHFF